MCVIDTASSQQRLLVSYKYDKLFSTVGGKPLLGCFARMFTVSAISNARDYQSSTLSTGFSNSCRKTVPSTYQSSFYSSSSFHQFSFWL